MDWIWLIVALLVGLAVGGLVAWTLVKRRYGDRESVVELRTELDRYKGKVTEHFVETADLVNTLTRNYKRVYDHLEAGAYDLVGEETLRRELDAPAEAPVMIEYLGQRRTDVPAEPNPRSRDTGAGVTSATSTTSAASPTRATSSSPATSTPADSAKPVRPESRVPLKPSPTAVADGNEADRNRDASLPNDEHREDADSSDPADRSRPTG